MSPQFRLAVTLLPVALLSLLAVSGIEAQARLTAGDLQIELSATGTLAALRNTAAGIDYLHKDTPAPLLTLVSAGRRHMPTAVSMSQSGGSRRLTLNYAASGVRIVMRVREHATHLALDIVSASPERRVDAVIWGPYPTTISRTVGEVIGVVRDGSVSIGLQVLNMKTLGGDLPNSEGSTWARGIAATAYSVGQFIAGLCHRSRPRASR